MTTVAYLRFADEAEGRKALKDAGIIRTRPRYESVQIGTEPVTYWTLKIGGGEDRYTHMGSLLRDAMTFLPETDQPAITLFDADLLVYLKDKGFVTEETVEEPVFESRQIGEEDYTADTGLNIIGEAWRNDLDPPVKRAGWFANWIGEELPENLIPYAITPEPEFPFCIFAGHPPEAMRLRDEAAAALAAEAVAARLAAETDRARPVFTETP